MAFRDYSLTPASNTALSDGTYIGPNMLRNKVRPAFQQLAADGKALANDLDAGLAGVAAGLDNSGVITEIIRVNLARFGMREAATAAQNLAAINDAVGEHGGGAHRIMLEVPGSGNYDIDDIGISTPNIGIIGNGATFVGGLLTVSPAADKFGMRSLNFYHDAAGAILTLNASNADYDDIGVEKFGAGDGYMIATEAVTNSIFNNFRIKGGNGWFAAEVQGCYFDVKAWCRAIGPDDFFVVKSRNVRSGDLQIRLFVKGASNALAFGSEIGTLGGNALRPGRAENIYFEVTCWDCDSAVNFKPGAIDAGNVDPVVNAAYRWMDGYIGDVRGVAKIADATGARMSRAVVFSPARNALIEDYHIVVQGEGRFAPTDSDRCWGQVFFPDSTAYAAGGTGTGGLMGDGELKIIGKGRNAGLFDNLIVGGGTSTNPATQSVAVTIQPYTLRFKGVGTITLSGASTAGPLVGTEANTEVSLTFTPTAGSLTLTVSGAANTVKYAVLQAVATPGLPAFSGVSVVKQNAAVGSFTGTLHIDAEINGTRKGGIVVGASLDNAVIVDRFIGRNIATDTAGATTGGFDVASIVRAPGENDVQMANTTYRPVYEQAGGKLIGRSFTFDFSAAAGVDQFVLRQLKHDVFLGAVASGVAHDTVGASGVNYFQLELRVVAGLQYDGTALNGNPLSDFNTTAVGVTQFTPFNLPAMPANAGAGPSFEDRFLKAGAVIRGKKSGAGSGQPFVGSVEVPYVQLGPRT